MPQNVPFSMSPQLSSYTPTFNERAVDWLAKHWYGDNREGTRKAERLMDVANMTPLGLPGMAYDAGRAGGSGDYLGAGIMGAMSLAPGVKPKGFRAYHGSPHSFDKFDLSKIGTGEGAQSYGHGLYFADKEGTARSYRDMLSQPVYDQGVSSAWIKQAGGDNAKAEQLLKEHVGYDKLVERATNGERNAQIFLDETNGILEGIRKPRGSMYEVQINADPEHFLDWDKPLSEQPEHVREAIGLNKMPGPPSQEEIQAVFDLANQRGVDAFAMPEYKALEARLDNSKSEAWKHLGIAEPYRGDVMTTPLELTGGQYVGALQKGELGIDQLAGGKFPTASERLRSKGIPGIKYLDAGSRAGGDAAGMIANYGSREKALEVAQQRLKNASMGYLHYWQKMVDNLSKPESRNYVVFDAKLIDIIRKYGLAGLGIGMGGAASFGALGGPQQQQQAY